MVLGSVSPNQNDAITNEGARNEVLRTNIKITGDNRNVSPGSRERRRKSRSQLELYIYMPSNTAHDNGATGIYIQLSTRA